MYRTLLERGLKWLSSTFRWLEPSKQRSSFKHLASALGIAEAKLRSASVAYAPRFYVVFRTHDTEPSKNRSSLKPYPLYPTNGPPSASCDSTNIPCTITRKSGHSLTPVVEFTHPKEISLELLLDALQTEKVQDVHGMADETDENPCCILAPGGSNPNIDTRCSVHSHEDTCHDDLDNVTLLALRLDRCNIVLDSACPSTSPHIVITPPPHSMDDYYVPLRNRVDPQWSYFLTAPPLPMQVFQDQRPHLNCGTATSLLINNEPSSQVDSSSMNVFSATRSSRRVQASCAERLTYRYLYYTLGRHAYKAAAIEASTLAHAACERFRQKYTEQDLSWSDPAQPILEMCKHWTGCTIMESDSPFSVPHILICEPPPQDPWIEWMNRVNEQDARYLGVFSSLGSISTLSDDDEPGAWDSDSHDGSSENLGSCDVDLHSPMHGSATGLFALEYKEGPSTGVWYGRVRDGKEVEFPDSFDISEEKTEPFEGLLGCTTAAPSIGRFSLPPLDMVGGDGDDLPEFDDWYKSTLAVAEHL
ncbi:hypothetical protein BS17DRAFT_878559 [Gyrodon lividus]|nr:hypothetical protein BS17DRAFT_878559 [Gyrodon lividus]